MKIPKNATDFELWQYRLIKTFWESDLVEISKKHPALTRRKKQWSDHELSSALVNRFKNYGRRTKLEDNGSEIYSRSAYLDDLFALCSATGTTPNDVLLDTVCSKINSFDTVYDIWDYLMKTHYDERFFSQISIRKEDLSIKLPHNSEFVFNLILNIDFYFEEVFKYSIQQSIIEVKYRMYTLCKLFDNSYFEEILDTIQYLLQESDNNTYKNLVKCQNFMSSLQPYWKLYNNTFDSFDFSYGKWNKDRPFYMSFSLFVVYSIFVSIEKICKKQEMTCDEYKDFLNNDFNKDIRTLILSLLRNSFCFINDNTFIACNGKVLSTSDIDDVNEYCNAEEQAPHSKGSINDKINFDSRNSFYKQSTVQENR